MLVLLGPGFDASERGYQALARVTGLVPYDLRTRVKSGSWGMLRSFADAGQANEFASKLIAEGFPVVVVDRQVTSDPERRHVPVQGVLFGESDFVLRLKDREMRIPYGALACIVEGEVQPGRAAGTPVPGAASSGSLRAVTPGAPEMQVFREAHLASPIGYLAADLHFSTVHWIARVDSRGFDFGAGRTGNVAVDLANFTNTLAQKCGVRVDRSVRSSSVASFAEQPLSLRGASWPPASLRGKDATDPRFDSYSRLLGEAERLARRAG
ncbi:MAG TPA: hypothetical protein VGQ57_17270 [Polyangiaceae bacterium]|nr:hypothetical protein [Polyangiaceae bacterium]